MGVESVLLAGRNGSGESKKVHKGNYGRMKSDGTERTVDEQKDAMRARCRCSKAESLYYLKNYFIEE